MHFLFLNFDSIRFQSGTALHIASVGGHAAAVEELLKLRGIDIDQVDDAVRSHSHVMMKFHSAFSSVWSDRSPLGQLQWSL